MWKRISNLFSKPEPPKVEKSMLQLAPGDICEVSLVTYEVTGRVHNRGRNAVVLTLQDGEHHCLSSYRRTRNGSVCVIHSDRWAAGFSGRGSIHHRFGRSCISSGRGIRGHVSITGRTALRKAGSSVWQYQSDDYKLLRIEWQNGRFMLYEGEKVIPGTFELSGRLRSGGMKERSLYL